MKVEPLRDRPDPALATALARFEEGFRYPLGDGRWFRIDHGEDYTRFFRCIGEGVCYVARDGTGEVRGTLAVARRLLALPDGTSAAAWYCGDLKVAPGPGRPWVFAALACCAATSTAREWFDGLDLESTDFRAPAFAVVMEGTAALPERYTGRSLMPEFRRVAEVAILRLGAPTRTWLLAEGHAPVTRVPEPRGRERFLALSRGRCATPPGDVAQRVTAPPVWLVGGGGTACGLVEDTARAKRLVGDDGREIRGAHLSAFAWSNPAAGAAVVAEALRISHARGFPFLWVAVPPEDEGPLVAHLPEADIERTRAFVYAHDLPAGVSWNLNTAEV